LTYLFDIYTYFVLSKEVFSHYIKNNEEKEEPAQISETIETPESTETSENLQY